MGTQLHLQTAGDSTPLTGQGTSARVPVDKRRFGRSFGKLGLLVAVCLTTTIAVWDLWPRASPPAVKDVANYLGRSPIELSTGTPSVSLPMTHAQLRGIAAKIVSASAADSGSTSAMLHATRLSRLVDEDVTSWMKRDHAGRIVELKLDSGILQDSWRGVETRQTADGERTEHRDQLLCALAQFGVPLSCIAGPRGKDREPFRVRDLLRTSLDEFHLNQAEMSWTAIAYALYLPPQLYWFNRYGERFDFDDLTRALMNKSLASESCSGIHLMLALTAILKVDRDMTILTDATRKSLDDYLSRRVEEAAQSQLPDGSWPVFWARSAFEQGTMPRATPTLTFSRRITITGHLLEWFHLLPEDKQPPETTIKAALLWVAPALLAMDDGQFASEICPATHAVLAVNLALPRDSIRRNNSPPPGISPAEASEGNLEDVVSESAAIR